MNMLWVVAAVFVILFAVWISKSSGGPSKSDITVYGSMGCPWTVKQIDYLKEKGKKYEFVDCASGNCPSFVSGFPTSVAGGQTHVGYTEF